MNSFLCSVLRTSKSNMKNGNVLVINVIDLFQYMNWQKMYQ